MHINVNDLPKVDTMLADQARPSYPAQPMPATTWLDIAEVAAWEERLRHNAAVFGPDDAARLTPYWAQVVALFEVYRQIVHQPDQPLAPGTLAMLRPGHRWLIAQRWPTRMPHAVAS